MNISAAINCVLDRKDLSAEQMTAVMRTIMTGQATDAQIGGLLCALRMKGETAVEIAAAANVMRELATPVNVQCQHLVDIVGTGGDGHSIFNVSTASSFVAAAAGAHVAKHGNRSVSSSSGSADLLEKAGVNLTLKPEQIAACVEEIGIGFMFAVNHHSAMKHAVGPRKELGARTLFNLIGPLTNPANVPNYLLGIYGRQWLRPVAEVLKSLNARHAMVVHSAEGLDEISIAGETYVAELKNGEITEYAISPEQFGLARESLTSLKVADSEQSLHTIGAAFDGTNSAARNTVALNAGAALYVAGVVDDHAAGIELALATMASGAASKKMRQLAAFSQQF